MGHSNVYLYFLQKAPPIALIMVMMMMMGDCLKFYELAHLWTLCCMYVQLSKELYILLLIGPPDKLMIKFRLRGENVQKVFGRRKKKKALRNNIIAIGVTVRM